MRRDIGQLTRPWKGVRTFRCPNCAVGLADSQLQCENCGEITAPGRFDWAVVGRELIAVEDRPPSLTGTVEEVGQDAPTVRQQGVSRRWEALCREDPALSRESLAARLSLIYQELTRGWNQDEPLVFRPYVSDGQFLSLQYWLDAYRAQSLRNHLESATLDRFVISRITRDKHYDAVTVRLWATGLDYTTNSDGSRVVGGSKRHPRTYSEYWTLIRGSQVRAATPIDGGCPSCGAELHVGMSGECEHCLTNITRGDFDWVLSKIEQDDSYSG